MFRGRDRTSETRIYGPIQSFHRCALLSRGLTHAMLHFFYSTLFVTVMAALTVSGCPGRSVTAHLLGNGDPNLT
jgi:hypothetical protein